MDPAMQTLIEAVDRYRRAVEAPETAHAAAEQEYAEELVALAARSLVRRIDRLHEDDQPIGWR